jgi:hypothetical protein
MLEIDNQNREHIRYMREELKPTATFSTMPTPKYLEIYHVDQRPGLWQTIRGAETCLERFPMCRQRSIR